LGRGRVRNKPFMPQNPRKAQVSKTPGSSEEMCVRGRPEKWRID
jgi:hypothetical protein